MFLNREAMRVVEKNDRGLVTYRKRYKFGDEVDTDHIDDVQVENLTKSGVLVESEDDLTGRGGPQGPYPGSQVTGAATGEAREGPDPDAPEDFEDGEDPRPEGQVFEAPEEQVDPATVPSPQDITEAGGLEVEPADRYASMDYSELQEAAKAADLRYVGVSAEDLKSSLRANDNS